MSLFYDLENLRSRRVGCVSHTTDRSTIKKELGLRVSVLCSSVLHTHPCTDTPTYGHTLVQRSSTCSCTHWVKGDLTGTVQVAGLMSQFCCETLLLWTWPGSDYICQLLHLQMILPPLWRELLISSSMSHQLYYSLPFLLSQEGSFYDLLTTIHRGPSKMQQPSPRLIACGGTDVAQLSASWLQDFPPSSSCLSNETWPKPRPPLRGHMP